MTPNCVAIVGMMVHAKHSERHGESNKISKLGNSPDKNAAVAQQSYVYASSAMPRERSAA